MSNELARTSADGDPLVRVHLVPVEVFGADEEDCPGCGVTVQFGYGLCDAVQAWSDCNRAIGHIYRVDEESNAAWRKPGDTITIYVPQSEMPKFQRRFGDVPDDRCPGCHVCYDELPEEHTLTRPTCTGLPAWRGGRSGYTPHPLRAGPGRLLPSARPRAHQTA